jgi:hypothetical protein
MWHEHRYSPAPYRVLNGLCWHGRHNLCQDFFPRFCSGGHLCSYYVSILTYVRTKKSSQTTTESKHTTDTLRPKYLDSPIQFLADLQLGLHSNGRSCSTVICTRRRGMAVLYSECLNHCSPLKAPQFLPSVPKLRTQTDLLSAEWSLMTMTNDSLIPHITPECERTQSLDVLNFFSQCSHTHTLIQCLHTF